MADIVERATRGDLDPVYILISEQPLLVDRAVSAILEAAVPEPARGFNYDMMEGKGLTATRVLNAAQTLPMMAQRRMVLIREISAAPAGELAKLVDYLDSPNPSTVLVATASKVDKRVKFYARARKHKALHDLAPPKQLGPWIRSEARALKVQMDSRAASRLVDVIGKDLSRISLSLEQLALYAGDRPIAVADVDDLIADTRERTVFELTDAIGQADLPGALAAVTSLCEQRQSAIGVVVMLARHMRQLGMCQAAMSERLPKGEVARRVGVPPFIAGKLMDQARRYPPGAIPTALGKLSRVDRALKGQTQVTKTLGRQLGERVLLDRLVTDLVGLSR